MWHGVRKQKHKSSLRVVGKDTFLLFFDGMGSNKIRPTLCTVNFWTDFQLVIMYALKCCKNNPFDCFDFCFLERMNSLIITFKKL